VAGGASAGRLDVSSAVSDGKQGGCIVGLSKGVCVFITAGPGTKLFAWGGGGYGRTCATRDDEPRPVCVRTSLVARVNHQAMSEVGTS
jgi:hypothetical protein